MQIVLNGNDIHKLFMEIEFGPNESLFPKNISILKFLQKCKITYILKETPIYIEDWTEYIVIPKTEEEYNKFEYHILLKNTFIVEDDILTITNISNTEEEFFYFKMKYF